MEPKMAALVTLNEIGQVTHLRGVEVSPDMKLVTVLTEQPSIEPPRETAWALEGAYNFANLLRSSGK